MSGFISRVRAGDTAFYGWLKGIVRRLYRTTLPVPRLLKPVFRLLYELHFLLLIGGRWFLDSFYRTPLFRSRCARVGANFRATLMPWVLGSVEIDIGDDVTFFGKVDIVSGRVHERPRLVIRDRVGIGHLASIVVCREIVIEEDVLIAGECRISDSDRHPKNAVARARKEPITPRDVRPVRICRYAWIGQGCYIMKGVTVGEGAIIGANSVVISDIPPYSIALGNPAQVYFRNVGRSGGGEQT